VVSFTPQPLYPRETSPFTHWIGDWVGSRAGLDAVAKRKNFLSLSDIEPQSSPARIPVTILLELSRLRQ